MKEINNNIKEDYCSFEVSKLLKEKGLKFPLTSEGYCWKKSESRIAPYDWFTLEKLADYIDAPTHAIAIEWLRINFGIFISIEQEYKGTFWAQVHVKSDHIIPKWDVVGSIINDFNSPQEATELALKYVLEKLI